MPPSSSWSGRAPAHAGRPARSRSARTARHAPSLAAAVRRTSAWRSQILGDGLELANRLPALARRRVDRDIEAVIEMVLDQRLLRLADGLLDGMQLLGEVEAGSPG